MRAFLWFLAALILAVVIGACVAYPAFELASHMQAWAFHRVASRIAMLILAVELYWLARHLLIRTKRDFGYGLPWRRFVSQSLLWGCIGIASAIPAAVFLLNTRLRVLDPAFVPGLVPLLKIFLVGVGSGIAVAIIEETVFRGALHTAIERESGPWAAAFLTASLFALLHFFARVHIAPEEVGWGSGFDLLARSIAPLAHPLALLDSFLAWFVVFLVLSLTRVLTGNIAVAMGLHGGWVVVLRMLQQSTQRGPSNAYDAWVGNVDALVGYWILPWGLSIAAVLWASRRIWVRYAKSG